MSQEEFERCVAKIGWAESEVRRRVGIKVLPSRKRIKTVDFTPQQVRCIRFLALNEQMRSLVLEAIRYFPATKVVAVRPVEK